MPTPLTISYQNFEPDEAARRTLGDLVDGLERYGETITDGRMVVEAAHRHGERTNLELRLELDVPRKGKIVVKRQAEWPAPRTQPSLVEAATEAVRIAEEQLREHREKMRVPQDAKALAHQPTQGRIARLNDTVGNGFIEVRTGPDLFFAADVLENAEFGDLAEGDEVFVTIAEGEGPYGPQASSVRLRHQGA